MSGNPSRFRFELPRAWIVVFLMLVPLVALGPGIFGGKYLGPFDAISKMVPAWPTRSTDHAWDILQADGALQFFGWRDLVFEAHRTGKQPFWNPYQLMGTPLLANSQSAGYYPLHLLFGVSALPTGTAILLLAWIHLAIGALGVRALALRLGAGEPGAVFGAVCFALSPFAVAWTALPSVMTTCCWIPVSMAGLHEVMRKPSLKSGLLFSGSLAMMATGGHLQFFFYGVIALLLAGIAFLFPWEKTRAKGTGMAIAAVVVAMVCAWCQIGPTLAFSKQSHRAGSATAEGFVAYQNSGVKPWELVGVIAPGFLGSPAVAESSTEEPIPGYWPMQVKPGGNYAESALYLGAPLLLALLLARRLHGRGWLAPALIAGFGLLSAMGTVVNAPLYFGIPGFSATGSPGRASILFVLGCCVIGALAIPRDLSETDPKRPAYRYFGLLAFCGAAIWAMNQLGTLATWIDGASVQVPVARRLVETAPILILCLVLAGGAWWCWEKKAFLWIGTAFGIAAHIVIAQTQILPFSHPIPKTPKPTLDRRIAFVNGSWDFFRPVNALMPPNTATLLRIQDVGGYDSLMSAQTVDVLRQIDQEDPAPPVNGNMMFVKPRFDPAELAQAGVSEVWSRYRLEQMGNDPEIRDGFVVYRLASGGIVENGELLALDTEGFTIKAKEKGPVETKFINLSGWRAHVGNQEIPLESGDWIRLADVPAGATVRFDYHPPGSFTPVPLYMLALAALFVALAPLSKSRPNPVDREETSRTLDSTDSANER